MLTKEKYNLLVHELNNGGVKSVGGLSYHERNLLIRHFIKESPKCNCEKCVA
jgi:hypothetical protein